MFELLIVGIICAASYITCCLPKKKHGRIVVSPGEGQIIVKLDFEPSEVKVYFLDEDCHEHNHKHGRGHGHHHHHHCSPPSCAHLKDEIKTIRILPRGFKFTFVVESGIRTIEWKVRR